MYQMKFGTYALPTGLYVAAQPSSRNVPSAKLPRADGARIPPGYLAEKRWTVQGGLTNSVIATGAGSPLRTQLDNLKTGLAQGPTTWQTDTDRYWRNCQAVAFSESYEGTGFNRIVTVRFDILTGDPYAYETAVQSFPTNAIAASPTVVTLTAGGNAPALPQWSLTVGGSGAVALAATVTNQTTGEAFILSGSVTGGTVLVIDSLNETVTIGGADNMLLFDGNFPKLAVGANSIQVAYSSGTITNLGATWSNRWY
jgi:hypothetical protein